MGRRQIAALSLVSALVASVVTSESVMAAPDRVTTARKHTAATIAEQFKKAGVAYPPKKMLLRAFKSEGDIEVWAGNATGPLSLVTTHKVCAKSGGLGPKRMAGDAQVPEGVYIIEVFNPWSSYHLSLGLNYPNDSDRKRSTAKRLGGDIFIHGDCVTIGCLPIEEGPIEELYVMASDAQKASGRPVPVHVFPTRMTTENMEKLAHHPSATPEVLALWQELRVVFDAFEADHLVPRVRIGKKGEYVVVR